MDADRVMRYQGIWGGTRGPRAIEVLGRAGSRVEHTDSLVHIGASVLSALESICRGERRGLNGCGDRAGLLCPPGEDFVAHSGGGWAHRS